MSLTKLTTTIPSPGPPRTSPSRRSAAPVREASRARPATSAVILPPPQPPTQVYTATLRVSPSHAKVGEVVELRGTGYPAGEAVELVWYTVEGRYELEGGTEFVGQRYEQVAVDLPVVRANDAGEIQEALLVPADFGGPHDIRARVNGREIAQVSLAIAPSFSLTPKEGTVGTLVELRIDGVEWDPRINTWHLLYDNRYLGYLSAVTTRGVAIARLRAAGPEGNRQISVWHNSHNPSPYLNWQQGPFRDVPGAELTFRVTEDAGAPAPFVEDFSSRDEPWPITRLCPGRLAISVDRGAVGTPTILRGSRLPPDTDLSVRWWTMVGNRIWASGFSEQWRTLASIRTGVDGSFELTTAIPDDLGGQHRLEVVDGDDVLAAAGLVIGPSVVAFEPRVVRAGDAVNIHLKGVGWTTYDNVYAVTYDNTHMGYVCGFATNGDVRFTITATGQPGTHLVDLYPVIYKGRDPLPKVYAVPHLSYMDDHPQRCLPAIRLALEIVNGQ